MSTCTVMSTCHNKMEVDIWAEYEKARLLALKEWCTTCEKKWKDCHCLLSDSDSDSEEEYEEELSRGS